MEDKKKDEQSSEEKKTVENVKEDVKKCENNTCCSVDGKKNIIVWVVLAVLVIGVIVFFQMKKNDVNAEVKPVSDKVSQEVTTAAMDLIEGELVPEGTAVEVTDVKEESGLYRVELTVEGQEVTSYMTKDLTKFIPQLIDTKEFEDMDDEAGADEQMPAAEVQTKLDKPEVELFVMSHCPYGTQMEKGILPVMSALGSAIDAQIKFVDYSMHGEPEVTEQLRQYCIQEKEPQKYATYLSCFLESEDAAGCDTTTGVNQSLLTQCVAATDAQFGVMASLNDQSSWVSGQFPQFNIYKEDNEKYGVQGSPTLVVNGEVVETSRDSASLLATICSGFTNPPAECATELSSVSPAPGFGSGADAATGTAADAACGV